MNIRNLLSAFLVCAVATSFAQEIENDDMYFNSKDREKLNALRTSQAYAFNNESRTEEEAVSENVNPTDSYSARNINPEYISRSNARSIQEDEDYFVNNYQYRSKNYYDNWDRSYSNWANNSWYNNGWYSPSFNSWYSPYYGYSSWGMGMYDPFYTGWYDPFYPSYGYGAWPGSYNSYYYGNSWGYGWGAGLSYSWGSPYCMRNNFWGPSWSSWGRNYYYPGTVIIVDDNTNGRNITYGRRASRGGTIALPNNQTRDRNEVPSYDRGRYNGGRVSNTSGRVSTTTTTRDDNTRQDEYYNRSWRRTSQESSYPTRSSSTYNNGNSSTPNRTWSNSDSNSGTRTRSWSDSNSNSGNYNYNRSSSGGSSSSSPSYSPPSRSSSGSSGSSGGSNGRTRRD